jgi:hypothetical protein
MTHPPLQTVFVALAVVLFAVAAYLHGDLAGKLTCAGLVALTIALVL